MPGTLQSYNESFLKALDSLNPNQRKAVEQIEGPVLVIAGPGTGKTHILTARIGRILMETDAQPQNILCLTFTDAGVLAMRERLLSFIGPEAHRVHIYTFHSFCNTIIQDNLERFGRHDLEPLSDLERVEIIRKIIDDLPAMHLIKRGYADPYFYENHLYDLFKRMKAEGWTENGVLNKIDEYLEDLPNRPEYIYKRKQGKYNKGDLKEAKINEVIRKMERLKAAVQLYSKYIEAQQLARRYDYEDMILWVLRAFEEDQALLRSYQEQYLYFLIDEYQDTNGAQNEIIRQLIHYWENPNIFIVGDDDQSIYEFQGARLKNLTDFYQDYQSDLALVLLKNNYRSTQAILDISADLIEENEKRIVNSLQSLGLDKHLIASNTEVVSSTERPKVVCYPMRIQEETDIVNQIEQLRGEGISLEEVAIIYARHRQSEGIINLLDKKNIPYNAKRKVNILDIPLLRNLIDLLDYFAREQQSPHSGEAVLFRILHFKFFKLSPADLATMSLYLAKLESADRIAWRKLICDEQLLKKIGVKSIPPILAISDLIEYLLSSLNTLRLPAFLERLINRSGLLQFVIEHEDKVWFMQVVKTFFDFVKEEANRNPRLSLKRLLTILQSMDDNRLPIELNKTISAEQGVNLLTAHSAKGLEFQYVFLLDCVSDHWEPRGGTGAYRFPFPDTLTFSGEEDATEARRRLFYVAMTRAKFFLHISYSKQDDKGKELARTQFLDEILEDDKLEVKEVSVAETDLIDIQLLQLTENTSPRIPEMDRKQIGDLLDGFSLSVSAMYKYLKCPLSFYYENILRAPVLVSDAANYGTAMHNALQRIFEKMLESEEKQFPEAAELVRLFEYEMAKRLAYFPPKEYERRLDMGRHNLTEYYRKYLNTWPKQVKVELSIRNVEVDGVPVNGTIDRISFLEGQKVKIVDYKTGRPDPARLRKPTDKKPLGGQYWRQLVFYKLLFESSGQFTSTVETGTISYLEPDKTGKYEEKTIDYSVEELEKVKGMIKSTYEGIMNHQFYEGCNEPNCQWCNFVKDNQLTDSFSDPEIEALDDK